MENKFKQFLSQFNNKSVEVVDPTNKNQCVDLVVAFLDFIGTARSFNHLYAYQIYTDPTFLTKENFDLIPNTPDGIPQVGDIVVFSKAYNGTAGHVVIATGEGDTVTFKAFSQNDPTGSPSVVKIYGFKYVLGWLRYKYQVGALSECLKQHEKLVTQANKKDEEIADLKDQIKTLKDADDKSKKQLDAQQNEIESIKKDKNTLEKKLELLLNDKETQLALKDQECEGKIKAQEISMSKTFDLKEQEYKNTIEDLEKQVKEKEIIVEKEPIKPKTIKDRLIATIEIWFR